MNYNDLHMSQKPFSTTSDPFFYYMTDAACIAYHRMAEGIELQTPHIVLSGDPGTGKTTLVHYLMDKNFSPTCWLFLNQTSLSTHDLFIAIGRLFKISDTILNSSEIHRAINRHLKNVVENKKTPVLIVDEAQCLSISDLKELLKWQAGIRSQGIGLTIIFSGQNEFSQHLRQAVPTKADIDEIYHCRLAPLTFDECHRVIVYRLKKAGYKGPALFSNQTLKSIFSLSRGNPRRVLSICDLAIFTTAAHIGHPITPKDIREISEYILRTMPGYKEPGYNKPSTHKPGYTIPGDNSEQSGLGPISKPAPIMKPVRKETFPLFLKKYMTQVRRLISRSEHFQDLFIGYWHLLQSLPKKLVNIWHLGSSQWQKTFSTLRIASPNKKKALFWPWGWAASYLFIIIVLGYAWLPSPAIQMSPSVSTKQDINDQRMIANTEKKNQNLKNNQTLKNSQTPKSNQTVQTNLTVKNNWQASLEPLMVKTTENVQISDIPVWIDQDRFDERKSVVFDEQVSFYPNDIIELNDLLTVPDWPLYEADTNKENTASTVKLAAKTELASNTLSSDTLLKVSTRTITKKETNQKKDRRGDTKSKAPKTSFTETSSLKAPSRKGRSPAKNHQHKLTNKNRERTNTTRPNSKHLITAIEEGNPSAVSKALADGADPNALFSKGQTALTAAVENGYVEIAQLLVGKGAGINFATPYGETALMKSVWKGNETLTKWLLDNGAQVNLQNDEGRTALFYAAIKGQTTIVDLLINHGAKWDHTDKDGRTPLMAAAWNNHINIAQLLLSAGAKPNRKDRDGWTPLMFAAFGGHANVGKTLLSHGADPSLKNNSGQTSTDLATQQGHSELFARIPDHIQLPQEISVID